MNQIAARTEIVPLTNPEAKEFEALSARLRAPDAFASASIRYDEDGALRLARVVFPTTLTTADLERFKALTERQKAPVGPDIGEAVAARLMAAFPAYRHSGDPATVLEMLSSLIATAPAPACRAMTDPTDPRSLIRTAKFAPSISEVSIWIDGFMAALLPPGVVLNELQRGFETLERLKSLPGFQIEKDRANAAS